MNSETLVIIAGVINLLCGVLHIFFPKLLRWNKDLESLSETNQATMRVLNICLMLFWFGLGYLYLWHAPEMVGTSLGKALLVCMCLFWGVRTFVLQPIYLGFSSRESVFMTFVFLVCLVLNAAAVIMTPGSI